MSERFLRSTSFDTLELEIAMNYYSVHSQSVNANFTLDLTNRVLTEHRVFDIFTVLVDTHTAWWPINRTCPSEFL